MARAFRLEASDNTMSSLGSQAFKPSISVCDSEACDISLSPVVDMGPWLARRKASQGLNGPCKTLLQPIKGLEEALGACRRGNPIDSFERGEEPTLRAGDSLFLLGTWRRPGCFTGWSSNKAWTVFVDRRTDGRGFRVPDCSLADSGIVIGAAPAGGRGGSPAHWLYECRNITNWESDIAETKTPKSRLAPRPNDVHRTSKGGPRPDSSADSAANGRRN
ncbi:hypothetical protein G7046_g155 [Stylonectria norvegica]|nr:hypothetical protein G7046_g155 [Stylonectria norvegica]